MNRIIIIFAFMGTFSCSAIAQSNVFQDKPFSGDFPIDSVSGKIMYKEVINCKRSKAMLYKQAKIWFAKFFQSGKDVIQLDDRENGQIIGKVKYTIETLVNNHKETYIIKSNAYYTITINVKDNAYRYILTDFTVGYNGDAIQGLEDLLKKIDEKSTEERLGIYTYPRYNALEAVASIKKTMAEQDDF